MNDVTGDILDFPFDSKPTRSHGITKAVEEAICLVFGSSSPPLPSL